MSGPTRALFVTYAFPPSTGPAVLRSTKFAKYLPSAGVRPVVVSADERHYGSSLDYGTDATMLADVRPDVPVHRVRGFDPSTLWTRLQRMRLFRLAWTLAYPFFWERQLFWALSAARQGAHIARRTGANVLLTTSPPYSTLLAGALLRRRTGLPWVADLRDPWTFGVMPWVWPTPAHRAACERVEAALLCRADAIVYNCRQAMRGYRAKHPGLRKIPSAVVPNGYDLTDYAGLPSFSRGTHLTLGFAGSLASPLQNDTAGGSSGFLARIRGFLNVHNPGIDGSSRTCAPLFRGIAEALRRDPGLKDRLRVRLFGRIHRDNRSLASQLSIDAVVCFEEYRRRYTDLLAELRGCDALLLLQEQSSPAPRAWDRVSYVPGKIYEYLALGRPIVALAEPGDAREIAVRSGLGRPVDPACPNAIASAILQLDREWLGGGIAALPNADFISSFERRFLTASLARLLGSARRMDAPGRRGSGSVSNDRA